MDKDQKNNQTPNMPWTETRAIYVMEHLNKLPCGQSKLDRLAGKIVIKLALVHFNSHGKAYHATIDGVPVKAFEIDREKAIARAKKSAQKQLHYLRRRVEQLQKVMEEPDVLDLSSNG